MLPESSNQRTGLLVISPSRWRKNPEAHRAGVENHYSIEMNRYRFHLALTISVLVLLPADGTAADPALHRRSVATLRGPIHIWSLQPCHWQPGAVLQQRNGRGRPHCLSGGCWCLQFVQEDHGKGASSASTPAELWVVVMGLSALTVCANLGSLHANAQQYKTSLSL